MGERNLKSRLSISSTYNRYLKLKVLHYECTRQNYSTGTSSMALQHGPSSFGDWTSCSHEAAAGRLAMTTGTCGMQRFIPRWKNYADSDRNVFVKQKWSEIQLSSWHITTEIRWKADFRNNFDPSSQKRQRSAALPTLHSQLFPWETWFLNVETGWEKTGLGNIRFRE